MLSPPLSPRNATSASPPSPPSLRRLQISLKNSSSSLLCWSNLSLLMPTVNPGAPALGFSDSLTLLSQVKQPADSFQPSSSTPASGSNCEVIRERGLQPWDPAVTLFSVKWDEQEGDEEEQDRRRCEHQSWPSDGLWWVRRGQRCTLMQCSVFNTA